MNPTELTEEVVGSTVTVRLDSRTDNRLRVVAELLTERDPLGRAATISDVVRAGIDAMYEKHATLDAND